MKIMRGTRSLALAALLAGCSPVVPAPTAPAPPAAAAPASAGRATSAAAARAPALMDVAYRVASAMPSDPHARDRAKLQELVALACVEVGDLDAARRYADPIVGWRRGEALAIVAQRLAARGDAAAARALAADAMTLHEDERYWARERVATEVAKAFDLLGEPVPEALASREQLPAEFGRREALEAGSAGPARTAELADAFDRAIATRNFDLVRGAVAGYLAVLARPGLDAAMRDRATAAVDGALPGLPKDLQVTTDMEFAEALQAAGRPDAAAERLRRGAAAFDGTAFLAEDIAPIGTRVALARLRTGDPAGASAQLDALHAAYRARRGEIVDLRRATSLRALAEGYARAGARAQALECWAEALEEGVGNPNSRPRAEDLCATCVSMATCGIEPTPQMQRRIDEIRAALGDPW